MAPVYHPFVADSLTLIPVGVGGAYARPGEAQSAYLVRAGAATICLDLGAGALNRLQDEIAPEQLAAIVISHLHPDHCADLFSLRVYMSWGPGRGRRVRVLGPPDLRERLIGFSGSDGWDDAFAFEVLEGTSGRAEVEGLGVVWEEVPHIPPTFAIRVEAGGVSLTYGADCAPNDALVRLATRTQLLITECSHGAEPLPPAPIHLSGREAGEIATRAGAERLLLTHCYPEHDRDAALALARASFAGPVGWARQGEAVAVSED
jgi:ribonuclease BN (tRNA processing enzyme)